MKDRENQFGRIGMFCSCGDWHVLDDRFKMEGCSCCLGREKQVKSLRDDVVPWGKLTSIDLHCCNPCAVREEESIRQYVEELCDDLLLAKRYGPCQVVHFGEDERVKGYSMVQLIETSLVSGHFVERENAAYLDVFSCGKYDPESVAEHAKKFFQAKYMMYHIIWRK